MPGLNINPEYMGEERRELSLLELNNLVRGFPRHLLGSCGDE